MVCEYCGQFIDEEGFCGCGEMDPAEAEYVNQEVAAILAEEGD